MTPRAHSVCSLRKNSVNIKPDRFEKSRILFLGAFVSIELKRKKKNPINHYNAKDDILNQCSRHLGS